MLLSRRSLLVAGSVTAAAGALQPAFATSPGKRAAPTDLANWRSVRALFDLSPEYTHLGLFFISSHPRPVRDAIEAYRKQIDADPFGTVEHGMFGPRPSLADRAAMSLASYLGVDAEDVALTHNTTEGLALIYHGLPLRSGDEVLTTAHDHMVHHESIRLAVERAGGTWRKIALFDSYDRISADEIVARIVKAIGPKTRAVGVTWVHSSSGLKLPIRKIADAIAELNRKRKERVLLIVDGVHGVGCEAPNLIALGCDALAAGAHKWLLGPRGTGFVWAKPDVWATMRPLIPSFTSHETFAGWLHERPPAGVPRARWFTPGGFHAFEHYWALPAAIELHHSIGPARITERIHALNRTLNEELAKIPNVTVYTPRSPELSAGIVCFDVKGMAPREVVAKLRERKVLGSETPYERSHARLSCGIYNDEADIERALRAVRAVAA